MYILVKIPCDSRYFIRYIADLQTFIHLKTRLLILLAKWSKYFLRTRVFPKSVKVEAAETLRCYMKDVEDANLVIIDESEFHNFIYDWVIIVNFSFHKISTKIIK